MTCKYCDQVIEEAVNPETQETIYPNGYIEHEKCGVFCDEACYNQYHDENPHESPEST